MTASLCAIMIDTGEQLPELSCGNQSERVYAISQRPTRLDNKISHRAA
ncbi:hypothetical protein KCP74_02365 [Salmonella enterica subsp. enterica]|nr:hypothetical protein KCP74_02365 [Salmonella enterica subsp. enterica]